jgi:hypothetical protein
MKLKLIFTILLSFVFCLLYSQVPQGFNYQAVARNVLGNPIANTAMPVRITIQSDSLGGTVFWKELHSTVTTSSLGVINIVVGKGAKQAGSTAATFSSIDWSVTPKFIKTEIDYDGWKTMGVSRLWSVPYAMVAGDLDGPVKKLAVKSETSVNDEALFEVKNTTGQTVFAVYNEGVRVYVADGDKGLRGGFAVGGFDNEKASSQSYFIVNPDSIRAYIGTNPGKGIRGGFAVGGFGDSKAAGEEYFRITRDSARILINQGTKSGRGGFAVGGFDESKGSLRRFVDLTAKDCFIGDSAGLNIKDGKYNIFIGPRAGYNTIGPSGAVGGQEGSFNCYIGYMAGYSSFYGANNTIIGYAAGYNNTSGLNTFLGSGSGYNNTTGYSNTFIGTETGQQNSTGSYNVFLGRGSGRNIREGNMNTFIGTAAGANIKTGEKNIIIGDDAAGENFYAGSGTGSSNIIIGWQAGYSLSNSSSNIFIGNQAGYNETGSNKLVIENSSSATPLVYGNFDTDVLRVNGDAEAGAFNTVSDIALKQNITKITDVTKNLSMIRGVYFDWNKSEDPGIWLGEGRQIGVIAQEVEKVYPELVITNDRGYKMVDYPKLAPILIEAIKEQQNQIETQQKEIDELKVLVNSLIVTQTAQNNK